MEEVDTSKTQIIGSIYKQGEKLRWLFTTHDTNQRRINVEAWGEMIVIVMKSKLR